MKKRVLFAGLFIAAVGVLVFQPVTANSETMAATHEYAVDLATINFTISQEIWDESDDEIDVDTAWLEIAEEAAYGVEELLELIADYAAVNGSEVLTDQNGSDVTLTVQATTPAIKVKKNGTVSASDLDALFKAQAASLGSVNILAQIR